MPLKSTSGREEGRGEKWVRRPVLHPGQSGLQKGMFGPSLSMPSIRLLKTRWRLSKQAVALRTAGDPAAGRFLGWLQRGRRQPAALEPGGGQGCGWRRGAALGFCRALPPSRQLGCDSAAGSCDFQPAFAGCQSSCCGSGLLFSVLSLAFLQRSFSTNL